MKLIDKDAVLAELKRRLHFDNNWIEGDKRRQTHTNGVSSAYYRMLGSKNACESFLDFIETLEVKYDSLEKFKSLQHISRDLKSTLQDWGYAPNLYFCDEMWHVSWISCEEGDSIKDFEGNTPEEAIDKACNWFHSTFCNS